MTFKMGQVLGNGASATQVVIFDYDILATPLLLNLSFFINLYGLV